jgi:hypothetical protein
MNNIFYLNISKPNKLSQKMGLCNQLYAIKGTCEYAYENNINTIVIENFLTDIVKNTYCNISDIIDLNHLNNLLKKYNIKVLDWNTDTGFEKTNVIFNEAPYWNVSSDCYISTYILSNLKFNSKFYDIADEILKKNKITAEPCNVIHLRLENDAIECWSKINGLSPEEFKKILEIKYIKNIDKYINKSYITIVVASEYDNNVIKYLRDNGYLYLTTEKRFKERELNAIVDLIITQRCDRVILGFFESSFVFTAMMRIIKTPKTQKIYFFCKVNNEEVKLIPD